MWWVRRVRTPAALVTLTWQVAVRFTARGRASRSRPRGLLAWIDAGFHSGRGLVVDWLTAASLGWAAVCCPRGLLLLLAWLLKRVPTRLLAFGASGAVVVGGVGLWTAAWLGPILAGVLLVAGGLPELGWACSFAGATAHRCAPWWR